MVCWALRLLCISLLGCPLAMAAELQLYTEENPPLNFSRAGQADGLASAVVILMAHLAGVPRAVLALHPVMTLMALTLARTSVRLAHENSRARRMGGRASAHRAVVLGAGEAAKLLIAGIQHRGWTVVGLLDDDRRKHGMRVAGVTVWGGLDRLLGADSAQQRVFGEHFADVVLGLAVGRDLAAVLFHGTFTGVVGCKHQFQVIAKPLLQGFEIPGTDAEVGLRIMQLLCAVHTKAACGGGNDLHQASGSRMRNGVGLVA